MKQPTFTVCTPTFNRAQTLDRVFMSLRAQTYPDFEWLVIDDGSQDGTRELVSTWRQDAHFPIRYIWQRNAGKPTAVNRGVREAAGELFLNLDSDDTCVPEALERLVHHWESISPPKRDRFVGVTGLTCRPDGVVEGDEFPENCMDATVVEIRRYRLKGEKWGFQRTAVLRKYPAPIIPGEKFIPESIVWNRIGQTYYTRFVNEVLRTHYPTDGSLRSATSKIHSPIGTQLYYRELTALGRKIPWGLRFRGYANLFRFGLHAGEPLRRQFRSLDRSWESLTALPIGVGLFLRDCSRYGTAGSRRE